MFFCLFSSICIVLYMSHSNQAFGLFQPLLAWKGCTCWCCISAATSSMKCDWFFFVCFFRLFSVKLMKVGKQRILEYSRNLKTFENEMTLQLYSTVDIVLTLFTKNLNFDNLMYTKQSFRNQEIGSAWSTNVNLNPFALKSRQRLCFLLKTWWLFLSNSYLFVSSIV